MYSFNLGEKYTCKKRSQYQSRKEVSLEHRISVVIIVILIISYSSQEILFRWIITLNYSTNTRCWSVWRKRRAILALVVVRGFSTLNFRTWLIAPQITLSSPLANPWSDSTVSSTKNLKRYHVSRYFSNQIILYKTQCSSSSVQNHLARRAKRAISHFLILLGLVLML